MIPTTVVPDNTLATVTPELAQAKARFGIVGTAPALIAAVQRALRVAPIDLSVLITGESGAGKEFFPKIIHAYSTRKHARYIAVNCGAIPEGTIDSELFGHEKGAFTGAVATRKGYFEEADGGTIFLDEVAELPLTTQARLLRVLESGEFIKVGSSTVQRTNIRIVAATNVDMEAAVREGRFREDLFYRLSTVGIHIPPLRERGGDISLLARKFAADFAEQYRVPPMTLTPEALDAISRFRWPGNVRQLKNVIDQMALFEAGHNVGTSTLAMYLPQGSMTYSPALSAGAGHSYDTERELLFNMLFRMRNEIDTLRATISAMGGNPVSSDTDTPPVEEPPVEDLTPDQQVSRSLVRLTQFHPMLDDIHKQVTPAPQAADAGSSRRTLEQTERDTIMNALRRNEGRRKPTAAELNISERTLYRKIKEYGLE